MTSKSDLLSTLDILAQVEINDSPDISLDEKLQRLETNTPSPTSLAEFQCISCLVNHNVSSERCSSNERFVYLSLECLLRLKGCLEGEELETGRLLSVAQQKSVRTLLDHIVDVGIWPNLLSGVSPPGNACIQSPLSDLEKYECLCVVTGALVELYHNDTFHGVVLPQFLSPLLCCLCQLTMVPLKKSAETYPRLQRERTVYQRRLEDVVTKLYQPMVIKELMVIEGNRHTGNDVLQSMRICCGDSAATGVYIRIVQSEVEGTICRLYCLYKAPKWMKQGVGRLLTQQLHRPNGVLATLNAVRDAANCTAPNNSSHLESVAKVITASPALDVICPQILELLDSTEAEVIRVGVLCVKSLHTRDADACSARLLQPITRPLLGVGTEQEVTRCLQRLHKCFAVPASDLWCLPARLLLPYIRVLFALYLKVHQSASCVRQITEDLVWRFLSSCEDALLKDVFRCLLYGESVVEVDMGWGREFVFGDDGGVKLIESRDQENKQSLEEFGDCLMILLERRDTNGLLGNRLFVALLEFSSGMKKEYSVDGFERQLVSMKLLAVLSESESVQKSLSKNPEPIVNFLKVMIEKHLQDEESEVEIICLVLVVLNVILNDCIFSKSVNWRLFSLLEQPLSQLKTKAKNVELQMLAEEAYEVIVTRGVIKPKRKVGDENKRLNDSVEGDDSCSQALRESCDPLLPVRGHALIQLGKLLAAGNKLAKTKKDQILCIFQENLKEEDSFLYLSAIEGLATAAAEFPDTVILSLTEQFGRSSLRPETRLKVGEALVRVTKMLGDVAPVYKAELINAFLAGTRDDDFLVRASSLSNLGELCRVLGFRVGPIIAEVLMCARCVAGSDPSVEVRRAAVMLVALLLKGLDKDTLTVLQDVLLELYHTLKHIYNNNNDDVTRLHAQLALEELNASTLAFLFLKPQLTKQIFVLDPPT